jgi:hypothetical protein
MVPFILYRREIVKTSRDLLFGKTGVLLKEGFPRELYEDEFLKEAAWPTDLGSESPCKSPTIRQEL